MLALDEPFPDPAALIVIPDHYIVRMLYSQGVPMESLGIPRLDGGAVESDPRAIWQLFADHFYLFRGTPSGAWLAHEFEGVFGIDEPLTSASAMRIYDRIEASLRRPEFRPRALFERFKIEVLCTTDAATDTLEFHRQIRDSGWSGVVRPTFRPDLAINIRHPQLAAEIDRLSAVTGEDITSYDGLHPGSREPPALLQVDGRDGHRPRGGDAVHGRHCRRAEATALFERALAGEGHRRRRARLHRPHADGDGAHEHGGRARDAAASRVRSQSQSRGLRDGSGRIAAATSRCRRSTRAT